MNLLSRGAPVTALGVPLDDITDALRERSLVGHGVDADLHQLLHVALEERGADHGSVGDGRMRAPIVVGDPRAPQGTLCRLLGHAGIKGAPNLVDELRIDLEPVLVVLLAARVRRDQPAVHEIARFAVRDPDVVVDVGLPHLGDFRVGNVQAVLLDSVQRDEFDVRVIVAERAPQGAGQNRDVPAPVFRVDLQGRVSVVVGGVHPVHEDRDGLVHVEILEREAHVVAKQLPVPESRQLVHQLVVADHPLLGVQVGDRRREQRERQASDPKTSSMHAFPPSACHASAATLQLRRLGYRNTIKFSTTASLPLDSPCGSPSVTIRMVPLLVGCIGLSNLHRVATPISVKPQA